MNEITTLKKSLNDFLTPKMVKFAILPIIITPIVLYILFVFIASSGIENLALLELNSTQTSYAEGRVHTEVTNVKSDSSGILNFLMHYALTSWVASFLLYSVGAFLVVYASIFFALIIIGLLTPAIIKELHIRHYGHIERKGYSNIFEGIFLTMKWLLVMAGLFLLFMPLYLIPVVNIIAFNIPFFYLFHKMMHYDIASNILTREEAKQIGYFNKNEMRLKSLALYILSLIPFTVFFTAVFFVIYLGHTYFEKAEALRARA